MRDSFFFLRFKRVHIHIEFWIILFLNFGGFFGVRGSSEPKIGKRDNHLQCCSGELYFIYRKICFTFDDYYTLPSALVDVHCIQWTLTTFWRILTRAVNTRPGFFFWFQYLACSRGLGPQQRISFSETMTIGNQSFKFFFSQNISICNSIIRLLIIYDLIKSNVWFRLIAWSATGGGCE